MPAKVERVEITCPCGKMFRKRLAETRRRFCSKECSFKHGGRPGGSKPRTSTCKRCSEEFECGPRGRVREYCEICRPIHYEEVSKKYHSDRRLSNLEIYNRQFRTTWYSRYGLTLDQYEEMWIEQDGKCKICKKSESGRSKSGKVKMLAVDHCHATGKIRGLLCENCNHMLGRAKDNMETLVAAAEYLRQSS